MGPHRVVPGGIAVLVYVLLGALQGLTEFLPVSSSGHLVLAERLARVGEPPLALALVLHLATLVAALWAYADDWSLLLSGTAEARREGRLLALALAATALVALPFQEVARAAFLNLRLVGVGFLATSVVLAAAARTRPGKRPVDNVSALLAGAAQGLALYPGFSRSGATIGMLLLLGVAPAEAVRFSFLLAAPTILGASAVELWRSGSLAALPVPSVGLAFAVSCGMGWLAIRCTKGVVVGRRLHVFAAYTLLLALATAFIR